MKPLTSLTACCNATHSVWLIRLLLLVSLAPPEARAATNSPPWFNHILVGMEVGPTDAHFAGGKHAPDYAANFSGRDIVRRCVGANAE
jgi:hypothetical protein